MKIVKISLFSFLCIFLGYIMDFSIAATTTKSNSKTTIKTSYKSKTIKATTTTAYSLNPCDSFPCRHNGTCKKVNSIDFTCICNPKIGSGTYCENLNPCWTFPCNRGGTCLPNGSKYRCLCNKNSYGSNCQFYRNPLTFNSTILSQELLRNLTNLVGLPANSPLKLLYQASLDGFSPYIWYTKVNGIIGTLTVIQSTSMNIFGGYTQADWSGYEMYKTDSNAFLFSLVNNYSKPAKMNVKNPNCAIFAEMLYGPIFGHNDLGINLKNESASGFSYLGYSFEYPNFISNKDEAQSFLAGSFDFDINEIEVYYVYIDPCFVSPCKNDGKCKSSITNFTCACKVGFTGKYCDYPTLNSTIFPDSSILNNEDSIELVNLINFPLNQSWNLLYQSSNDGYDSFFSKCGTNKNLLLIVKTFNRTNIFGGFTSVGLGINSYSNIYDPNAFLFSFRNSFDIPVVMNVTDPYSSIYDNGYDEICFGNGNDLFISFNYNDFYTSHSDLGNSYQLPNFINQSESQTFLAGSYSFKISELEAYAFDQCWKYPCLNGGVCVSNNIDKSNPNVSCNCINGYAGSRCQSLDSTNFLNSKILTEELGLNLINITGLINRKFKLLYQGTRDTFYATAFHSKCNGVLGTLTVVKTTNGNIFGGYTQADWSGYNYEKDQNAFLFSLINSYNISVKMNLVDSGLLAIYTHPNHGPAFGYGCDIFISDQADSTFNSYSALGYTYQKPRFVKNQSFLAGSFNFKLKEIEVYSVTSL